MKDLHKASEDGDLDAARASLGENPYAVTVAGDYRRTPLHLAAQGGHTAIVDLLLRQSAQPNARDYGGGTPLHAAAEAGRLEAARSLLAHGAKLNLMDEAGDTALHRAVRGGHAEVAELLLAHGADPNLKGDQGGAPLHEAAATGRLDLARLLLSHGAFANAQSNATHERWSPWHEASRGGRAELAELLRRHGGADPARGPIAIDRAAAMGYEGRLDHLLERDPKLISSRDFLHRRTPLHWAAAGGHEAIVRRLIAKGADVHAVDKHGRTPRELASAAGFEAVAELLRRSGRPPVSSA